MADQQNTKPVRLLKPSEAAIFLAVSERTVKRLTARGELPHVRVGRSMRFVLKDLLAYVASQRRWSDG
jgi:excisionase family DNA binding protein